MTFSLNSSLQSRLGKAGMGAADASWSARLLGQGAESRADSGTRTSHAFEL